MDPRFTGELGENALCEAPGMIPAFAKPLMALRASSDTAPMSVKPWSAAGFSNTIPAAIAALAKKRAICHRSTVSPGAYVVSDRPVVIP